jgi:hypothetical protein
METVILGSGRIIELMAMEFMSGNQETNTRGSGILLLDMVTVLTSLQMGINTWASTKMVCLTDKVSTNGRMEMFTSENSRRD